MIDQLCHAFLKEKAITIKAIHINQELHMVVITRGFLSSSNKPIVMCIAVVAMYPPKIAAVTLPTRVRGEDRYFGLAGIL